MEHPPRWKLWKFHDVTFERDPKISIEPGKFPIKPLEKTDTDMGGFKRVKDVIKMSSNPFWCFKTPAEKNPAV